MSEAAAPSLENAVVFRAKPGDGPGPSSPESQDTLCLTHWNDDDWRAFLRHTDLLSAPAGEPLIRRGESNSNLYFIVSGEFEISSSQSDSLGPLLRINEGSVIGEQAFFDGGPRSANAWGIRPSTLLRMSRQQFRDLESANPKLARDLLFSLARILAVRLRRMTARVTGEDASKGDGEGNWILGGG